MKLCFIDIETTGTGWKSAIIQIAGIIRINGKIVEKFDIRMRPPEGAEIKVNRDLNKGKRTFSQEQGFAVFINILEKYINPYDKEDKFFFIAYNARFDEDFIRGWFKSFDNPYYGSYFFNPSICVMQMAAQALMLERTKLKNFKLMTVARYFNIKIVESKLHDATYDILKTKDLYNKLIRKLEERWKKPRRKSSKLSRVPNKPRLN